MLWESKVLWALTVFKRNRLDGNFFSVCQAAVWRLLVYLLLGPWCFLPESHFILLEWPSSGGRVLARLHIGGVQEILSASSPKENMNFPILHQKARPLDQVFAKVCKSLNEVACLTFSSLILFYTKIPPVNIDSRGEMWKIWFGFLYFQGCSCDAWSPAGTVLGPAHE